MSSKKPVNREKRLSQAIDAFEKAWKALGRKDYAKAQEGFTALMESHPAETEVVERARVYRAVCERELASRAAFKPKGVDEMLAYGVLLHNQGDYEDALKQFRRVTDSEPRNDHALYCIAASAARSGENEAAIEALRAAIGVSPESRAQARSDSDFDGLRDDEGFLDLVYS